MGHATKEEKNAYNQKRKDPNYTPRSYSKLDSDKIVEMRKQGKTYREIGLTMTTAKDPESVIWRKISRDTELQQKIRDGVNGLTVLAERFEDKIESRLTNDEVVMTDKDMVESVAKLRNASVNLHKALRLETGQTTENINNPQQVIMIQNLYNNL